MRAIHVVAGVVWWSAIIAGRSLGATPQSSAQEYCLGEAVELFVTVRGPGSSIEEGD